MITKKTLHKISDCLWEIPQSFRGDMLVPARVYATAKMLDEILDEKALEQLVNMTTLPGIEKYAVAMPDIHQGYGFPIGGVCAFRVEDGIISPGGVGYDINCGVRLLASQYSYDDMKSQLTPLINQIQRDVPSGVGSRSSLVLDARALDEVLNTGVDFAVKNGFAFPEDQLVLEEHGHYKQANADFVSIKAKQRGNDQLGTLGAGNHFLEVQRVEEIYDAKIAENFGIFKDQITVMIHTGSRGLGHQVCTDYVDLMLRNTNKFGIHLVDRELACAPFNSAEGQKYFQAMAAAANFAWTNRQIITDCVRGAWVRILGGEKYQLRIIYDVAHNIAKLEKHGDKQYIVHRKGATRAFGPHHPDIPAKYQSVGQPVFIPGSMGTNSYVLVGTEKAMQESFGSACHGAGRRMSRIKAKKSVDYNKLRKNLEDYGVIVRANSVRGLLEEAPEAYKDVDQVVDVVHAEGIALKVAKMKPVAIVKG